MLQPLLDFFNSDEFMPHGYCFMWRPSILWLHVVSDAGIAAAYYGIPLALLYFVRQRRDLPFKGLFVLFAAFIVLCGTTHLMSVWVLWHPDYAVEGVVKAMTAAVSVLTFFVLLRLIPAALRLVTAENVELARMGLRLRGSEEKLRAVVEHTLDGLITIDEHAVIESFNPACENIFGYETAEVIGRNINMLMPEPYQSAHDGYVAHYLVTGEARIIGTAGREVSGRRKDGTTFPMELSVSAFEVGGRRYFSGIVRDISERKHYEDELKRSNRELEHFAYIASHDLKAPLRGIDNLAQWVIEDTKDVLPDDAAEKLGMLRRRVERLENLLNDILHYSRAGRIAEKPESVDVAEMLRAAAVNFGDHKGFDIRIGENMPVIKTVRTPLEQVFTNLIANAVKHHDRTEGVVSIACRDDGAFYEFTVTDDGPGIPVEFHERAFQMFQTLQSRDTREGSGLGLAIVKKLIEGQGGRVWIVSPLQDGRGTAFHFQWARNYRERKVANAQ